MGEIIQTSDEKLDPVVDRTRNTPPPAGQIRSAFDLETLRDSIYLSSSPSQVIPVGREQIQVGGNHVCHFNPTKPYTVGPNQILYEIKCSNSQAVLKRIREEPSENKVVIEIEYPPIQQSQISNPPRPSAPRMLNTSNIIPTPDQNMFFDISNVLDKPELTVDLFKNEIFNNVPFKEIEINDVTYYEILGLNNELLIRCLGKKHLNIHKKGREQKFIDLTCLVTFIYNHFPIIQNAITTIRNDAPKDPEATWPSSIKKLISKLYPIPLLCMGYSDERTNKRDLTEKLFIILKDLTGTNLGKYTETQAINNMNTRLTNAVKNGVTPQQLLVRSINDISGVRRPGTQRVEFIPHAPSDQQMNQ
uniref:NR LBD domain-containing protein n=1 Tax=Strongyloides papillosus TaxID=174720 RepID=A0A0N5B7U9_STREA